jgi:hypothetical protein
MDIDRILLMIIAAPAAEAVTNPSVASRRAAGFLDRRTQRNAVVLLVRTPKQFL